MKNLLILFIVLTDLWTVVCNAEFETVENRTVFLRSNAILKISLKNVTADVDVRKISCDVILNGKTRQLGDWTASIETPILKEQEDIRLIFDHRLTGSYRTATKEITILISNATFTDSGVYRCSCDGILSKVHLQVVGGPLLYSNKLPTAVSLNEGTSKSFKFVSCGNPPPKVTWTLRGNTTEVKGESVGSSFDISGENLEKFDLKSYCYTYEYTTPKLYRNPCNLTATYTVQGYESIEGQVLFSVSFKPEKLNRVQTVRSDKCLLTKWDGPKIDPNLCRIPIFYDVRIISSSGSPVIIRSYSTTFEVCDTSFDIATITGIDVRYVNKYGSGDYAPTTFVDIFTAITPAETIPAASGGGGTEDSNSFKNIAIATSSVLGLFLLVVIVFIIYYAIVNCKCCCKLTTSTAPKRAKEERAKEERAEEPVITSPKPFVITAEPKSTSSSAKVARKTRIRKENIVHKPQALSEVTSNTLLVKSKTFSGFDSLANRHADEATLQKGYMPLNTLQQRISESLQADNMVTLKRQSVQPIFEDIFENPNVEDYDDEDEEDSKRNSGASAATECTSLGSRTTIDMGGGGHLTVGRTTSLDSTVSDYDMPYHIEIQRTRRKSIYDLPRSQTFHGSSRPRVTAHRKSGMGPDVAPISSNDSQDGGSRYGSEYALPNVTPRLADTTEDNRKSIYRSPRKSIAAQPLDSNNGPSVKVVPNDDSVIYDRPRVNVLPENEIYDQPKARKGSFEAPVPSKVFEIYDTPKIHSKMDHDSPIESTHSDNFSNERYYTDSPADSPQETVFNDDSNSEKLYDNMNFIQAKYGVSPTTTNNDSLSTDIFDEIARQHHSEC